MCPSPVLAKRTLAAAALAAGAVLTLGLGDVVLEAPRDALFGRAPETTVLALSWERTHCLECEGVRAGEGSGAATARR